MDVLYLLVPLSVLAMLGVLAVFAWALFRGQFEALEAEGERVLLDPDQAVARTGKEESAA
jgi:cbb3-type cytochrome oxidase maturation protein